MSIQAQLPNEEIINILNQDNIKLIKDLFILIISELNESLEIKNKLFSIKNFFPDILFLKLDYFSKKHINTKDILHYLEQHNYKFNDEIIRRFIKQYDKNGNCNLVYEDFVKMISPVDNNINTNKDKNLEGNADDIFCNILIKELKLIGFIGEMIIQIKKKNEFDSYKIFMEISKNSQYLDKKEMTNFLEGKFTEIEINQLIYYLDSNNDGLITYDDFHDLLIPIKSDYEFGENINSNSNNMEAFDKNMNSPNDNMIYNQENRPYNNFLFNPKEYLLNKDKNFNEFKDLDSNKEIINKNFINNNNDNENLDINKNTEDNNTNYNISEGVIENNTKKNFNELLCNKYFDQDNFFDKNNEIYNDFKYKTANEFIPKILKEEKLDVPNIQDNTIYKNFIDNHNQQIQLNNDHFYQKNINISKAPELIHEKENYKNNITLQRFPITFGYENNILNNELNNNIIPKYNNNNENNSNNQMKLTNEKNNIINYKEQIRYYIEQNKNNNINPYQTNGELNLYKNINSSKELSKEKRNINIENGNHNKSSNHKNRNSIEDINYFLEYIKLITLNENKAEHIKENLALREDLSLKEIFFLFDKEQLNYISIDNFQLICKTIFKLYPTSDQIKLLFKRYKKELTINKKDIFSLNMQEFIQMMLPKKSEYINIINKQNKTDKTNVKLSMKSKKILTQLIKVLIQKETSYYKIKSKLSKNGLEIIWKEISKYSKNKGKIDKNEMNKFLEEYGYFLGKNQIDNIFLIFDKDQKGNINDNDYLEEMSY